jgi:hypothetical protein
LSRKRDKGGEGKSSTAAIAAEIERSLDQGKISWPRVLLLGEWAALTTSEDSEKKEIGERLYLRARETFQKQHGSAEIAVSASIQSGVYLLADGQLRISVNSGQIRFNTSAASRLILQIDALAEEAKEWMEDGPPGLAPDAEQKDGDDKNEEDGKPGIPSRLWGFVVRASDAGGAAVALRPHSLRAYSLATGVVDAIAQENKSKPVPATGAERPQPGPEFEARIGGLRLELQSARHRFKQAAQRVAQGRYWQGTMVGALLLTLLCVLIGLVFWWRGVDAAYGVALPAGGLGAMVSVLQRMSSGKLVLDIDAGRDLIEAFGAVRPFIGAIFGVALMALLLGGLVPAIEIPAGEELAFFAGLGFLAGFNERWAQDMLKGSADQIRDAGSSREQGPKP